ncbi:hypothetical protein M8494_25580 [Serratia ureilytica]
MLLLEAGGDDNNLFIKMPAGVAKIIAKELAARRSREPRQQPPHADRAGQGAGRQQFGQRRDPPARPAAGLRRLGRALWLHRLELPGGAAYFKRAPRPTKARRTTTTAPTAAAGQRKPLPPPAQHGVYPRGREPNLLSQRLQRRQPARRRFHQPPPTTANAPAPPRTYPKAVRDERRLVVGQRLAHRLTFEGNVATGAVYS